MDILKKEINFDRFVRGLLLVVVLVAIYFTLSYLSGVLIPFFVAWVAAYLLYPIVRFLQFRCRLRSRILCIVLTLILVCGTLGGLLYISIPTMIDECQHLWNVTVRFVSNGMQGKGFHAMVWDVIRNSHKDLQLNNILKEKDVMTALKAAVPKMWEMLLSTANIIISVVSSLIALLYLLFLLYDYEKFSTRWIEFIPRPHRPFARRLVADVERGMSGYLRGQALVALSNCVMFSIGFAIIGLPIPLGMGFFIGVISFVPYVQVVGFVPCAVLCLLKAAEEPQTGFWLMMGGVLLVYCVVQIIQDVLVTPKIMGKFMGLSPAVILLSLSVWGYMLGIIGLIIALPLTTLIIAYYKRYIIGEPSTSPIASSAPTSPTSSQQKPKAQTQDTKAQTELENHTAQEN